MTDYKPADRPDYIEAFFSNVEWKAIRQRLNGPTTSHGAASSE